MCVALRAFWLRRDRAPEGLAWTREALACGDAGAEARAAGHYAHAQLAFFTSDFVAAEESAREVLDYARRQNDPHAVAAAYGSLGRIARSQGDLARARRLFEQALDSDRESGDRNAVYGDLHQLGEIARDTGEYDRAEELLGQALAAARVVGRPNQIASTVHSLADLALDQADWDAATSRYRESLVIFEELGARAGVAYCLAGLASVAARNGDVARAGVLWGAAQGIEGQIGYRILPFERRRYERMVEAVQGPVFDAAVEEGRAMPMAAAIELAREDARA
jgi:tetratricopeptide (TPR) repeat protein